MQVTSDTLFHFTTSLKNLKNILSKKFHITYCREKYTLNNETHDYYFPMVSFCDIPLALAKDQIDKYGSYAIGMTKEWGIKNKLNPVVYIEKDSLLGNDIQGSWDDTYSLMGVIQTIITRSAAIRGMLNTTKYNESPKNSLDKLNEKISSIKGFKDPTEKRNYIKTFTEELDSIKVANEKLIKEKTTLIEYSEGLSQLMKILRNTADSKINFFRYIKNYQGTLKRKNKTIENYRFYDEREWRYIPAIGDKRVEAWLNEEQYRKYRGNSRAKPMIDKIILNFTSKDIKYLIIKSSEDIPKLIKTIKSTNRLTENSEDIDVLTTKILTVEQLNSDF
jgi:uncharacterized protein YqgV (UPF0045/DUF77 family)